MKFIGHINAIAAFREALEEYQPEQGVVQQDVVELVRSTYHFQAFPILQLGAQPPLMLSFMGGKFEADGQKFAIGQLLMTQEGDVVTAVTTEQADLVLDDLIRLLDETLGFRLRSSKKTKNYVSNVVVEFDRGLEEYIEKLANMACAINEARPGMEAFNIKRLAFGTKDRLQPRDTLTAIQTTDFLIGRRAGRPFEENRYFCSAPMTTHDHIRTLERIEAIARGEEAIDLWSDSL